MTTSETVEKFLERDICFYHAEVTGTGFCNPSVNNRKLDKMHRIIVSDIIKEITEACDPQEKFKR